jgi:very-short-patch-repair endonuclease
LRGKGCPECGKIKSAIAKIKPYDEYLNEFIKLYSNKYDYSLVDYKNANTKIKIICPKHSVFEITSRQHLNGVNCTNCERERISFNQRKTTNDFINQAKISHGDTYDYSSIDWKGSSFYIKLKCKKHGDFEQEAYCHSIGIGCPICMNKTEAKLYENIVSIFPSLLKQFRQEWCINQLSKTNKYLPFDFCIPEHKIIIELDGPQHFRQIMNWKTPEEQQKSDKFKEECANNNGYSVIRLLQEDVMNDTYDWVKELCDAIEEIKTSNEITNVYLSKNNEYDNF